MITIRTNSAKETVRAGDKMGRILKKGDLVCLTGGLGTGKTAFTSGIAVALGIEGYITSPTFTIVNEYAGKIPLYHFDMYRINDPEEVYEIGFDEYLNNDGIVVIEWAETVKGILPQDNIWVDIKKDLKSGVDVRIISMDFLGDRYRSYEEQYGRC